MAWLQEQTEQSDKPVDDKWLKIPDPEAVGKSTEVMIRILESEPADTWQHWLDNRVFNCPGFATCPVCKVRGELLKLDKKAAQERYRTAHRFFFNVLHDGKVKVFSFGSGLAKDLKVFSEKYEEKYGDIRSYDVTIIKRKTGKLKQNVEYSAIPEFPIRELSLEEVSAAETRYELANFTAPASREDLLSVAQGEQPAPRDGANGEESLKVGNPKATKADMMLLKALIEAKDLEIAHFGFVEGGEIDKVVVDKLINELQTSK